MAVNSVPPMDSETREVEQPWPIEREAAAYRLIEATLIREHNGEFVALHRGEALGFGGTPQEAVRSARDAAGRSVRPIIHRVGDPIPQRTSAPESFCAYAPREAVDGG